MFDVAQKKINVKFWGQMIVKLLFLTDFVFKLTQMLEL